MARIYVSRAQCPVVVGAIIGILVMAMVPFATSFSNAFGSQSQHRHLGHSPMQESSAPYTSYPYLPTSRLFAADKDNSLDGKQDPRQSYDDGEEWNSKRVRQVNDNTNRRSFVNNVATTTAGIMAFPFLAGMPMALASDGTSSSHICVIGANGKTGTECVGACLDRSIPARATSRSGDYNGSLGQGSELLTTATCDVTNLSTIAPAIQGSRAVIFAASASKQGGTPSAVDNTGLVNVAQACLDAKIPHLIIVSSGSVTKPFSPVYMFLNLFGNIMAEKIKGEDAVRAMYKTEVATTNGLTYTVIRPGGLTDEEGLGVAALELNQGDTKSGRIARADVASLCIESTLYPQLAGGTTYECYNGDTGKPLSSVGISNIFKAKNKDNDDKAYVSGKERRGSTWQAIFTGLERD
jgi:uncharacterized protein YbjT (DUF2867 family)